MAIKIGITKENKSKRVNFEIEAESLDEAFKILFRDYKNRYKYCNDISFHIVDEGIKKLYFEWIHDIGNYVKSGGDMW
jgi:hypothetical protein